MEKLSGNYIDSYEKKMSVQQIYQMYLERKLVFPSVPSMRRSKKIERISGIVEIILFGIALPIIYVSERQDGSLLVLEADDRLRCLIEFLEGYYAVGGLEFYPELEGCGIEQLERQFPRRASWLYDYKFSFEVIEYTTPRYMHMQMGNYIERWNFTREQGIRNELYGQELEQRLSHLERSQGEPAHFFSKWILNRQYMVLRILMYRFILTGDIRADRGENMSSQQLLDLTAALIMQRDRQWMNRTADALREATEELLDWDGRMHFGLGREKGKEWQAKVLGYLYNVVWICGKKECEVQQGLERVVSDGRLLRNIENEKENITKIQTHFDMIENLIDRMNHLKD